MNVLIQKQTANGQAFPSPRPGEMMQENPPAFIWLREGGYDAGFTLEFEGAEDCLYAVEASFKYMKKLWNCRLLKGKRKSVTERKEILL